ncbi:hypothetical protein R3P38DRAFT_2890668 [Favolaschia claudopus]|uniref:Zn(2)-C6 fungal-type domain-containing protein n=1 Tax=Favolaschia claudopus TaxID=2862362 RepID=A0AAW0CTP4_9AGAR
MKRALESSQSLPNKRSKSSQACISCRRQKSRCEILESASTIRCHRCSVLNVECSFDNPNLIPVPLVVPPTLVAPNPPPTRSDSVDSLNTLASVASSRPSVEETVVDVPTTTAPSWGSISRINWTTAPILAIRDMVRCPRCEQDVPVPSDGQLSDILNTAEITSLLEIFESRYTPWLCAQPGPLEISGSFLDIVRCTIASRHLAPAARSEAAPRLQKLTEDVFHQEIFNPQPSLDSLRALLILSVWTPICGFGVKVRDARLLIGSTVSAAMNLHIQTASKRASSLRAQRELLSPAQQVELSDCILRWRLWMHLAISESILCLGTGRDPLSHFSPLDQEMVNFSSSPDSSFAVIRDMRLGLFARMFSMTETALKLTLEHADRLGHFFEQINESLYALESLVRHFTPPIPVTTPKDTFYSQMLLMKYHNCRLLVIHHALRETRTVYERDRPAVRWFDATTGGHRVSLFWGRMALTAAENVLTAFLAASDLALLSTAPDSLFGMIGFASTWIFVSNFSVQQLGGSKLGGASELLQNMAIQRLHQVAHSQDHAAARCGHVLSALMNAWQQQQRQQKLDVDAPVNDERGILDISYASFQPISNPALAGKEELLLSPPPCHKVQEDSAPVVADTSDLFMDDAFWSAFLENLDSDVFVAQTSGSTLL